MYNHKPDFSILKKVGTSFYYCQASENPKAKKLKRFFLMITLYLTKENLPVLYRERTNLFKLVPWKYPLIKFSKISGNNKNNKTAK